MSAPILRYFRWEHLPEGPLRITSATFAELATTLDKALPDGAEKTTALRKLLESKDAAVRAALDIEPTATWTCVYGRCCGASFTGTAAAAEAWMDQHMVESPHDPRWANSFRIDYPGRDLPGAAYRPAVTL